MSPTIRALRPFTRTKKTARLKTSPSNPAPRCLPKESHRPAWVSRSATTIATATSTWSRRISRETPIPYIQTWGTRTSRTALIRAAWESTRGCWAGASLSMSKKPTPQPSGLGVNTRLLGWGVGFFDMDNDGWLDILMSNGHVYPEVDKSNADLKYAEHKYLYRNLQNGRFEEVTDKGGPGILENAPARGCAFGDYDNDGDIDVAVNCVNAIPQLLRCDSTLNRNWIKIKLSGVKSNRTGIGSRVTVTAKTKPDAPKPLAQMDELRSGGSYFSQNDMRMHFGLDQATKVDMVEIRWLSGQVDQLKDLDVNRLYVIQEGGKILKSEVLKPAAKQGA